MYARFDDADDADEARAAGVAEPPPVPIVPGAFVVLFGGPWPA